MIETGKAAPSFRLAAVPEREITLEGLAGKAALFFFYSKDNTSG